MSKACEAPEFFKLIIVSAPYKESAPLLQSFDYSNHSAIVLQQLFRNRPRVENVGESARTGHIPVIKMLVQIRLIENYYSRAKFHSIKCMFFRKPV